jgi:photosystem II stability/assembly factor-like uncharacterized protein
MDRLEHELRDVLTNERRALSTDLVSLDAVYAGAARRRRRRTAVMAAVGAFALAGAAIPLSMLLLDNGHARDPIQTAASVGPTTPTPRDTTTMTHSSPTPTTSTQVLAKGPAWSGARVASVTATSTHTFVVLGFLRDTGACKPPNCLRLVETHDGGKTFTALPVPKDALAGDTDPAAGAAATDVRFGSPNDGWLYGNGLWATHDGGYSWNKIKLPGPVNRLVAAHGVVWALLSTDGGNSQQLWKSPVGSDKWTQVPNVTVGAPGDVALFGTRVVVLGAGPSKEWVSKDGTKFTPHPSPCATAMAAELSASGSLWAKCATGTAAYVATSADGVKWRPVKSTSDGSAPPNSLTLGARGADDALLALGANEPLSDLYADGTQQPVSRPPDVGATIDYLGFTTARVGYAIDGTNLWRTDDGGDTWARLQIS